MRKEKPGNFYWILLCLFFVNAIGAHKNRAVEILKKSVDAMRQIEGLQVTILMKERSGEDINQAKGDFMISYKPFMIYMKQDYPREGLEVLYCSGKYNNKAVVNTNGFPWFTLYLNPEGRTMRKDHHFSIFQAGYQTFANTIEYMINKYPDSPKEVFYYSGTVKIDDHICYKIIFTCPDYKTLTYKVQKDENLKYIAEKFKLIEYSIIERNRGKYKFAPGENILIPSEYGKEVILYLDTKSYLPFLLKTYDDKGLFHEYKFVQVMVNPDFKESDFDINNPGYGFR